MFSADVRRASAEVWSFRVQGGVFFMSAIVGVSSVSISHLPPVSITNGIIRPSALLSRERNTEVTRIAVEAQRLARGPTLARIAGGSVNHLFRTAVAAQLGVSTRTLTRMVGSREFPAPLRIRNRPCWPVEVVAQWFEDRLRSCLDKQGLQRRRGKGA
jgi:predicted DNA-binding transcriptional regulator AlpA